MQQYVMCTKCNGSGKKPKWLFWTKDCPSCSGRGVVLKTITKAPPRVPHVARPIKRTDERVIAPAAPASDDGDIVAGVALVVDALSSDRGSTTLAQPGEDFKGGGGEGGGAGASGSWDKPEERTAEPEPVAEAITASEPSESASEPAASDSPSSSDSGSGDT